MPVPTVAASRQQLRSQNNASLPPLLLHSLSLLHEEIDISSQTLKATPDATVNASEPEARDWEQREAAPMHKLRQAWGAAHAHPVFRGRAVDVARTICRGVQQEGGDAPTDA